jgi:hypothetical protein
MLDVRYEGIFFLSDLSSSEGATATLSEISNGPHRIDLGGTARRDKTSCQGHNGEQQRNQQKRPRIGCTDADQQIRHNTGHAYRAGDS